MTEFLFWGEKSQLLQPWKTLLILFLLQNGMEVHKYVNWDAPNLHY